MESHRDEPSECELRSNNLAHYFLKISLRHNITGVTVCFGIAILHFMLIQIISVTIKFLNGRSFSQWTAVSSQRVNHLDPLSIFLLMPLFPEH